MKNFGSCTVKSSTLRGVEGMPVDVEVVVSRGMPSFNIVGMPDMAIQEAKERIRAAISACGFVMPPEKVVVNLAPGYVKKAGTGFDLPVAVGLLVATGQVRASWIEGTHFVGELSLEGGVKAVRGLLSHAKCALDAGCGLVSGMMDTGFLPFDGLATGMLRSLAELRCEELPPLQKGNGASSFCGRDFREIAGHEVGKRALTISAVGGHGLLMMGPPGSGKTMLASCLPSILPSMTQEEILECATIYSVAGEDHSSLVEGVRPFRAPHHSASLAGLIGGGSPVRPGEVSLAHNGVLFLDELAEFKPSVLQALRQPIESGQLSLIRADGQIRFPARFTLIAASNPCPCGFLGDVDKRCTCSEARVLQYRNRIGGPLFDRFDMKIEVSRLTPQQVMDSGDGVSSSQVREVVARAREFRSWRLSCRGGTTESEASMEDLMKDCHLQPATKERFERAADAFKLSGRGIKKTLGVARTIADLGAESQVSWVHVAEALQYRTGDSCG